MAHKVGHRISGLGAELHLCSLRGLEEHVRVAIAIELACSFTSSSNKVALLQVDLGDLLDGVQTRASEPLEPQPL